MNSIHSDRKFAVGSFSDFFYQFAIILMKLKLPLFKIAIRCENIELANSSTSWFESI